MKEWKEERISLYVYIYISNKIKKKKWKCISYNISNIRMKRKILKLKNFSLAWSLLQFFSQQNLVWWSFSNEASITRHFLILFFFILPPSQSSFSSLLCVAHPHKIAGRKSGRGSIMYEVQNVAPLGHLISAVVMGPTREWTWSEKMRHWESGKRQRWVKD